MHIRLTHMQKECVPRMSETGCDGFRGFLNERSVAVPCTRGRGGRTKLQMKRSRGSGGQRGPSGYFKGSAYWDRGRQPCRQGQQRSQRRTVGMAAVDCGAENVAGYPLRRLLTVSTSRRTWRRIAVAHSFVKCVAAEWLWTSTARVGHKRIASS